MATFNEKFPRSVTLLEQRNRYFSRRGRSSDGWRDDVDEARLKAREGGCERSSVVRRQLSCEGKVGMMDERVEVGLGLGLESSA